MSDNYRRLWDFYTRRGATPAGAAGMLAQVHAESRGNPGAYNPDDKGLPSVGMIQWRGDRNSALRTFANARGPNADALLTQAEFSMMELQGSERQAARFLKVDSPEEAGLGLANSYVRPAHEHRPERAGLARAFYEHFVNGAPLAESMRAARGTAPQFDPSLGEMPNTREGVMAQELQQRGGGGKQPSDILQEIMELGRMPEEEMLDVQQPQESAPAYQGMPGQPQPGMRPDQQAPVMRSPSSPNVGEQPSMGGAPSMGARPNVPGSDPALPPMVDLSALAEVDDPEVYLDTQLAPDEETGASASRMANAAVEEIGSQLGYEMGVPDGQIPRTLNETVRAANDTSGDQDEEKYRKRMLASEMLQALSIGLGQMSVGQAVDLSSIFGAQREYKQQQQVRADKLAEQRAAQAKEQLAVQERMAFAQQLAGQGMPELARMAATSEAGYKQAMSVFGNVQQDQLVKARTSGMTQEQRREALVAAGADDGTATNLSQFPELTEEYLKQTMIPKPDNTRDITPRTQALISDAIPYGSNPAVAAAIRAAAADPNNPEAAANLQAVFNKAVEDAGGQNDISFTPEQLDQIAKNPAIEDNQVLQDLIRGGDQKLANQVFSGQIDAASKGMEAGAEESAQLAARQRAADAEANRVSSALVDSRQFTPTEGKLVSALGATEGLKFVIDSRKERQEDDDRVRLNDMARQFGASYNNPEAEQLFANVQTAQELRDAISVAEGKFGVPSDIRSALYAANNPEARAAIMEYVLAKAGVSERLTPVEKAFLDTMLEETAVMAGELSNRRGLARAMEGIRDVISQDGYDQSGPLSSTIGQTAQDMLTDLLGDSVTGLIRSEQEGFGNRLVASRVGEFFQSFRPPGSGAVSDFESKQFIQAMPNITDSVIRQQGVIQQILRGIDRAEIELQAQQDYMLQHQDDTGALVNRVQMSEFIQQKVEDSGWTMFPTLNVTDMGAMTSNIDTMLANGYLDDNTVIFAEGLGTDNAYMTYKDFKKRLGL